MKSESPTRVKVNVDWGEELGAAFAPTRNGPEWKSVKDLCEATGRGMNWIRVRLGKAKRLGRLEVKPEFRPAIDGSQRLTYVYKMTGGVVK